MTDFSPFPLHTHPTTYHPHRDLKPENLLLASKGDDSNIKLADFGFATYAEGLTITSQCGTPGYIAPEILKSKPYGECVMCVMCVMCCVCVLCCVCVVFVYCGVLEVCEITSQSKFISVGSQ